MLALALLTASCGSVPQPESRDAWLIDLEGREGPQRASTWSRGLTIQGIRLGMDADAAWASLSNYSHVEESTDQHREEQPWHRRYVAWQFKPTALPRGDLASPHMSRANDPGYPAVLEIYTSKIKGREVVSGLSYRTYGSLSDNHLGPPTAVFPVKSNGNLVPGFAYAEDRRFADQKKLEIMDNCNGPPPLSGHFGG